MTRRLLLGSNTASFGQGPLEYMEEAFRAHFADCRRIAFVGFAKEDQEAYIARIRAPFDQLGVELVSAHTGVRASEVDGVFVGGGNTFLLVKRLWDSGWMEDLRSSIAGGMPYLGTSAGANVACPTLCTTNDMPIVQPPSFEALGVVPFQINAHYLDPDPDSTHQGETREMRLEEFHQHNTRTVIGLRESTWLEVDGDRMQLGGPFGARIFRPGVALETVPGADLSELLLDA